MRHFLLLCLSVELGLSLSACTPARCTTDAHCGSGQVCVASGICLNSCTSDAQCGPEQTCNARNVCVSGGSCAVSTDCAAGQICAPGGVCMTSTNPMVDAGPVSCGGQRFDASATEANILIVLDHSGSMEETIGNTARTKWQAATTAVRQVTQQHASNDQLRFGLQLFSLQTSACNPGRIDVPVGPGTVGAISNALPAIARGNYTPIGGALNVAATSGQLTDPARANYVLLITDGMENCNGAPVAEVEALFSRGVRTYSVGFGNGVDEARLEQMAVRGGTARASSPRYFQADSPADLEAALSAIASGAASCDFTLSQTPPDPNKLFVAVDGQFFPRDPARVAGWDYQATGNRVTLYGPACDIVSQRPGAAVSIIFGCPDDTLTEIGTGGRLDAGIVGSGDGGFSWPEDAGTIPEIN